MSKRRNKPSTTSSQYSRGASNALNTFVKTVNEKKLATHESMALCIVYAHTVEVMRKDRDRLPPFLSRAMAQALDALGIERYQDALDRMSTPQEAR